MLIRAVSDRVHSHPYPLSIGNASSILAQVYMKDGASPVPCDIVGRVEPDAPWQVLKADVVHPSIETIPPVPFVGVRPKGLSDGAIAVLAITPA